MDENIDIHAFADLVAERVMAIDKRFDAITATIMSILGVLRHSTPESADMLLALLEGQQEEYERLTPGSGARFDIFIEVVAGLAPPDPKPPPSRPQLFVVPQAPEKP